MIIDVKCTDEGCQHVKEILIKSDAPMPACEKCGSPTQRQWTMTRKGDNVHSNRASVGFRMNYMES